MANAKYHQCLSVTIQHDFYDDKNIPGLTVIPHPDTATLMREYSLMFKQSGTGFAIYCDDRDVLKDLAGKNISLCFMLAVTNPYLRNISDLPAVQNDSTYYFSNVSSDPGRFELSTKVSGLDNAKSPNNHFGTIDIFIDNLVTNGTPHLSLSIGARKTLWKYFILPKNNTEKLDLHITDGKQDRFTKHADSPVTLANGSIAEVFISNVPVAFSESISAENNFHLLSRSEKGDNIITTLPIADAKIIHIDKAATGKIYSEIYIHI